MSEIEIHISLEGETFRVGTLFRQAARGRESVTFEYHPDWLSHGVAFALEPSLSLGQ
ncbi:MAG TPA: type II toxin-antitoxin system HipA family toxin, partial [Hyphomonas sp.]|nr:type II toxin-antitoxin system HipA family toxin [Hyphomonas sp.]